MIVHSVIIRKTDKFILINYFLEGLISVLDPEQVINLLPPNITYSSLGKDIKENLLKSRKIEFNEFNLIISSDKPK